MITLSLNEPFVLVFVYQFLIKSTDTMHPVSYPKAQLKLNRLIFIREILKINNFLHQDRSLFYHYIKQDTTKELESYVGISL